LFVRNCSGVREHNGVGLKKCELSQYTLVLVQVGQSMVVAVFTAC